MGSGAFGLVWTTAKAKPAVTLNIVGPTSIASLLNFLNNPENQLWHHKHKQYKEFIQMRANDQARGSKYMI